jgi:hypothetical protein
MPKTTTPYQFFLKHAGYSYDPKTETAQQGRRRCARLLAKAEKYGEDEGFSFQWDIDPHTTSADWIQAGRDGGKGCRPWSTWVCGVRNGEGVLVGSLSGIDFGRNGEPWGDPYRRVVEAELILEEMPRE